MRSIPRGSARAEPAGGNGAFESIVGENRAGEGVRLWPWLAAALSGALATLCFAPFDQAWLCWFALTPLLAAIWFSGKEAKRRWLRDLLLGYVAGVVFFWSVFFWLRTVTVPGLILVGLYMGVYFAVWGWLAGLVRPGEQDWTGAPHPLAELGGPSCRSAA